LDFFGVGRGNGLGENVRERFAGMERSFFTSFTSVGRRNEGRTALKIKDDPMFRVVMVD